MIRPSDDPRWEEINPAWKYLDGSREYELLGTIQIVREHFYGDWEQPWVVKAAVRPVGGTEITRLQLPYKDPNEASEAKRNIEHYAGKIHWGYELVYPGPGFYNQ